MTANDSVCPYIVTGKEGTSYCRLAESSYTHAQVMALVEAAQVAREALYLHQYWHYAGLIDQALTPFTQ